MENKFKKGQEVICIDDSNGWISKKKLLKKGNSYVIESIYNIDGAIGLSLRGVGVWNQIRFVPIDYNSAKQVTFKEITEDMPVYSN
jgi:hypothetical protein